MKRMLVFGLVLMSLFSACRKNIDDTDLTIVTPDPEVVSISTDGVFGMIVDEQGNGLDDVWIRMGDQETTTDSLGVFLFKDATLHSNGSFLTATKPGFFPGSRTFLPVEGKVSNVRITLLSRTLVGVLSSSDGGEVTTQDGASVKFQQDGFSTASGAPYDGDVRVFAKWLNPDDVDFYTQMPGDLQAIDSEGEGVILATFGMLAVELEDPAGNKIQLAEGKPAEIAIPLTAELQQAAPESIPLWYFDEGFERWVEEGSAVLDGDMYRGEVSHFTYWNCDLPGRKVDIHGQVVSESGQGLSGIHVLFTLDGVIGSSHGLTMEDGYFVAPIPADEILNLEIESSCGDVVYSAVVGPFSGGEDLGQIVIPDEELMVITGSVTDCFGVPISTGYAHIKVYSYTPILLDPDGSFSAIIPYCNQTTGEIIVSDFIALQSSDAVEFNIEPTVNMGTLSACGTPLDPPYIFLTINGEDVFWQGDSLWGPSHIYDAAAVDGSSYGLSAPSTVVEGFYDTGIPDEALNFRLVFPSQGVANGLQEGQLRLLGNAGSDEAYEFTEVLPFDVLNITEYGASGEVIRGYFEILVEGNGSNIPESLDISGNFATIKE
jgi:hypothetical protein